jgi:hypothetical protein
MQPYLVGLGLAVFDMLVVVVFDFMFEVELFDIELLPVVEVFDIELLPVVEVLLIVDVLFAVIELFILVLVLLALVLLVLSLPPQAAPSAPIARTAESTITFFIT